MRMMVKARCLRGDEDLGVRTLKSWCDKLGLDYGRAWAASKTGGRTKAVDGQKYQLFMTDEPVDEEPGESLSACEARAREMHMSYGQMQALKYMAAQKESAQSEEEEDGTVTLQGFAKLIDGDCRLHVFTRHGDTEQWIMSIPVDSIILNESVVGSWVVECIKIDNSAELNVWIKEA